MVRVTENSGIDKQALKRLRLGAEDKKNFRTIAEETAKSGAGAAS